jgi:hypothetical protein
MTIELHTVTVAEHFALVQDLMRQGLGDIPVCATDCRGRYPFQAYTVLDHSGYTDALLLYVRPDAHFAQRDPLPINWGPDRVAGWNREADTIKQRCGAFGDRHHDNAPSYHDMKAALEKILASGHPDAAEHMPEMRGLSETGHADLLVQIASAVLGVK